MKSVPKTKLEHTRFITSDCASSTLTRKGENFIMTENNKPLIAVVGATSKQGRSVTQSLLESQQFRVRALTRNRSSLEAKKLEKLGAEIVEVPAGLGHKQDFVNAFKDSEGAFLMTPPIAPPDTSEFPLGCEMVDAAVEAGVKHIVFSTLANVEKITGGKKWAPHFTDKANIADYIRSQPIAHTFIMQALFYTNILEYYVPQMNGDTLLIPIYLPEDFKAPFVDPLTATGPAVLEIFSNPELYNGKTLPIVGEILSPREMIETFQRVTGIKVEYRNAYTKEGLTSYFPELATNELSVKEILGMVEYTVEYGYFDNDLDLEWSRRLNPATLNWEQFLKETGWRGEKKSFGA